MKKNILLLCLIGLMLFSGCNLTIEYDGIETVDKAHAEIHEGESFILSGQQTLANAATYTYIIDTTNSENKQPHLIVLSRATGEGNLFIWEGVTYTGGTANGEVNRNRFLNYPNLMTIIENPTINTRTTKLLEEHFGSGKNLGGDSRGNLEFVLDINQTYSIEFTSESVGNDVSWLIEWYEEGIDE